VKVSGVKVIEEAGYRGLVTGVVGVSGWSNIGIAMRLDAGSHIVQEDTIPAKLFLALAGALEKKCQPAQMAWVHRYVVAFQNDGIAIAIQ